jgi:hypothetical protein
MSEKKPTTKKPTANKAEDKKPEKVTTDPFTDLGAGVSALPIKGGCIVRVKGEGLVFAPRAQIANRPNGETVLF